ncbi:MAG: ribonuclease P protein component [Candidatus Liptonbacteria bacterium]|nr:ribonuclease P protein component [Candidatus Liptonbacteria bacterium]
MLPRKKRATVPAVLRGRPKTLYASPSFIVKGVRNAVGYGRFGVVVSLGVDRRATRRHMLKRIVLNAARSFPPSFSLDLIFILGRHSTELSRAALHEEVLKTLGKVSRQFP